MIRYNIRRYSAIASEAHLSKELSKNRKVHVKLFNDHVLVDIREGFLKDKKWIPSKTGISLSATQWCALKKNFNEIDKVVNQLNTSERVERNKQDAENFKIEYQKQKFSQPSARAANVIIKPPSLSETLTL
jgi:squalene cyclase